MTSSVRLLPSTESRSRLARSGVDGGLELGRKSDDQPIEFGPQITERGMEARIDGAEGAGKLGNQRTGLFTVTLAQRIEIFELPGRVTLRSDGCRLSDGDKASILWQVGNKTPGFGEILGESEAEIGNGVIRGIDGESVYSEESFDRRAVGEPDPDSTGDIATGSAKDGHRLSGRLQGIEPVSWDKREGRRHGGSRHRDCLATH